MKNLAKIWMIPLGIFLYSSNLNAQVWKPLDDGLKATPSAITSNGNLIAAAYTLGIEKEKRIHEVAIWNGVFWLTLPKIFSDSNSKINSLLFKDSGLYIAGKFTNFNSLKDVRNIVIWKAKEYRNLPSLSNSDATKEYINELGHLGDKLVVAGSFKNDQITNGDNLAFLKNGKWVNSDITNLTRFNGPVNSTILSKNKFIVGGRFTKSGSKESNYLTGFSPTSILDNYKNEYVPRKFVHSDTSVVFWGEHPTDKSKDPSFFLFNSDTLMELNSNLVEVIKVYDIFSDFKTVYAIGEFKIDGETSTYNLIRLQNEEWEGVPGGRFEGILTGSFLRGQMIVAGNFKEYQKLPLLRVAAFAPKLGAVIGKVFYDKDANCEFNSRDEALNDRWIHIQPGDFFIRPRENGNYLVYLKEGKYTFSMLPRKYWNASVCDQLVKTVNVEDGVVMDTLDFALVQDTGVRDLSVKLIAQSGSFAPRKNLQLYYINYENLGSGEVTDGKVTLHFDSKLQNLSANIPPTTLSGDSAVWEIGQILPGISKTIRCAFELNNNAQDNLNLIASISGQGQTMDQDQENNESNLTQKITEADIEIGKQVNPGIVLGDTAYIEPRTRNVEYQISFSNYSNDTVRNVYVVDTIGINHSMSEIRETGASHPYTYQIIPGEPGENVAIVIWTFKNINLTPNPNHEGEIVSDDGYIGFSIGLKSGLEEGAMLTNTAHVTFDYSNEKPSNPVYAIVTESVSTEPISFDGKIKIYPNPANNELNILAEKDISLIESEYSVINNIGVAVLSGVLEDSHTKIDINHLSSGLYFLTLKSGSKQSSFRFIKR